MPAQDSTQRPIVIMENDLIHITLAPFCSNATCPCKVGQALLAEVAQQVTAG